MKNISNKDNFIAQAGVLALAGLLCRVIGILYRSPLTSIIGDEGNGYYTYAYNIYAIILLISSYSIPSAISKVISQRLALEEYQNAQRIFYCSIIYVVIVGGVASVVTFICAPFLTLEGSFVVLRVFAPTIFLSGLLGVLRGYFQARRSMVETSVSQVLEQLLNAIISIGAAYLFIQLVSGQGSTKEAIYGAMGSALGTGCGVLVALIFMLIVYQRQRESTSILIANDKTQIILSYKKIFKIIILMVTPVILSTFIYNFSTTLNQTIFAKIFNYFKGYRAEEISSLYGIFAGKAVIIVNIPIALAAAMSSAVIPTISSSYALGKINETNEKINSAIKTTMLISIPAAVGLMVLAKPVTQFLFPQKESLELASNLLRGLSISVVFYALSTVTNAVLQAIGKVTKPVMNAFVSLVIQTLVLAPLLLFTKLDLYSLVIVTILYSFMMCVLNGISVKKCLDYKIEYINIFIKPVIAAIVMGAVTMGSYDLVKIIIKSNVVSLVISIVFSVMVYFCAIIKLKVIKENELSNIPFGNKIIKLAKKVNLIK